MSIQLKIISSSQKWLIWRWLMIVSLSLVMFASFSQVGQSSPADSLKTADRVLGGIRAITESSKSFSSWALAIIGGSILILVSTSYVRPPQKMIRYIYFLFVPAWGLMLYCLYKGDVINRRLAAAVLAPNEDLLLDIGTKISNDFSDQISKFTCGIWILVAWLLSYLIWWILNEK